MPHEISRGLFKSCFRLAKRVRKRLFLSKRNFASSSYLDGGYERPKRIHPLDRLGEYWLFSRLGWIGPIFRGAEAVNHRGGSGAHHVVYARALLLKPYPELDAIRIARWSRFGDSVVQLRNAIYIAESYHIPFIQYPESHPFFNYGRIGTISFVAHPECSSAPVLEGLFYNPHAFRLPKLKANSARVSRDYLRPLLKSGLRTPDPRVRKDDLVLHFRAGDVFTESPNPHYGQPPLSYYLSAVERERPSRVWLVYEDRGNPCISATELALERLGIEVVSQSSTLIDDLRVLMTARRLVGGRGSFVEAVANLSEHLERIYFFEAGKLNSIRALGVQVLRASDADGEFKTKLLSGNWMGSGDQHALMLSYPSDKLSFE